MKEKETIYQGLNKFKDIDSKFHDNIEKILELEIPKIDFIHQFPSFVGHVNLAKFLFFYDLYKKCFKLSGDIADVGTWKGASFFFLSKLVRLFEQHAYTQVHAFDWFQGMKPEEDKDDIRVDGKYISEYELLLKLIDLQELHDISIVHKMDLVKDTPVFFGANPHLRFKMVFIDCGITQVLEKCLEHFWPRLVRGGILIMDHYNVESSPSESAMVEKYIGENKIRQFPFNRQPTGYIEKIVF